MSDQLKITLHHPITEEEWDAITDVDFDHTDSVFFHTKHGKEVTFVKQKKGKWIHDDPKDAIEEIFLARPRCSECGFEIAYETNFCPNCGARMEL